MKKRLLLLGGGFEQLNAVRIAKEFGAQVVVFDGSASAACMFEADEFYQVNIKDHEALCAKVASLSITGVFVHAAELAVECALVAEKFDMPGISVASAVLGTDKIERSKALKAAGVNVPLSHALYEAADWQTWLKAAASIGYPFMVKPTRLAGAQGVEFIADESALKAYFDKRQTFKGQDFMLEQFVEGVQLSTESVAVDGKLASTNIAFRHYDTSKNLWPFQIEDGHSMPWADENTYASNIEAVTEVCREAFGIETGVLKGDIIISEDGAITVLEMAVRTSGGRFCDTVVPLSTGVNILYPLIQYALGEKPEDTFLKKTCTNGVSQRFVLLPEGAKMRPVKAIQNILLQPHVAGYWFRDDLNDLTVIPAVKSHRDRLGYVICTGETREIADTRAKAVVQQLSEAMLLKGCP